MKQDPLALAFFGAALALLVALLLYVFVFKSPESAAPVGTPGTLDALRSRVEGAVDKLRDKPAPAPAPAAKTAPAAKPSAPAQTGAQKFSKSESAAERPKSAQVSAALEPGRSWRYAVVVEPPAWRDITLTYRTQAEGSGTGVLTDFLHAGGKMNFHLGTYAAGHASHVNTRFPGFFMYASYFRLPLQPGQKIAWNWAWQPVKEDRRKAWDAQVLRWEDVKVPAGTFRAALIDANLYYIEGGVVRAQAKETLWYAPQVAQVVKVVREGRTPDEGSSRIVAELVEYR